MDDLSTSPAKRKSSWWKWTTDQSVWRSVILQDRGCMEEEETVEHNTCFCSTLCSTQVCRHPSHLISFDEEFGWLRVARYLGICTKDRISRDHSQDSMSELRALCYPGTDVLMLCFSVVRPETFRSVAARWVRAVSTVRAPVVLVGTQADLARDPHILNELRLRGEHAVTEAEARALASSINAEYIETSAKMRSKLKDAFDSAILAGLPVIVTKKPFWKKLFCMN